ncbi:MAG: hypothetical protein Kow0099_23430 [Candidatus Abyssubacteria bacterium]
MNRKEIHDIANILSPALSHSQNLLLGFHGDLSDEQRKVLRKIENCLKELHAYLQEKALSIKEKA